MRAPAWSLYSHFRIALLAASALSLILSVCIVGTAAHVHHVYMSQRFSNAWWLPLWPDHFDNNGTNALIASAVAVIVLNALYIIASILPKFNLRSRPTFAALLALLITVPSGLICLFSIAFAHVLNSRAPDVDTIQTWTCRFNRERSAVHEAFGSLCTQSRFALYGTLTVFLLQCLLAVAAIIGWVIEMLARRKERKLLRDTSPGMADSGNGLGEAKEPTVVAVPYEHVG